MPTERLFRARGRFDGRQWSAEVRDADGAAVYGPAVPAGSHWWVRIGRAELRLAGADRPDDAPAITALVLAELARRDPSDWR